MASEEASKDIPKPDYRRYADLDAWKLTTACLLVCDVSPRFRPPSPTGSHPGFQPWFINPLLKSLGFDYAPVTKLWCLALNAMKIDKLHAYEGDWTPMILGNPPDLPVRIPPGASGHMSVRDPKAGVVIVFHDPWVCKDEFLAFAERKGYSIPEPLRGWRNTDGALAIPKMKTNNTPEEAAKPCPPVAPESPPSVVHVRLQDIEAMVNNLYGLVTVLEIRRGFGLLGTPGTEREPRETIQKADPILRSLQEWLSVDSNWHRLIVGRRDCVDFEGEAGCTYLHIFSERVRCAIVRYDEALMLKQGSVLENPWGHLDGLETRIGNLTKLREHIRMEFACAASGTPTAEVTQVTSATPETKRAPKALTEAKRKQLQFKGLSCNKLEIIVAPEGLTIKRTGDRGRGTTYDLKEFSLVVSGTRRGEVMRWLSEIATNQTENATAFKSTQANHTLKTRFNQRFQKATGVVDNLLSSDGSKLTATAGRMISPQHSVQTK